MRIIIAQDILPMDVYARVRADRRRQIAEVKKHRRVAVGPDVGFYFENYQTMLHQVHEMLYIERGGKAQIADELRAYNPLIPDGRCLVATMMIEIDDPVRRARTLAGLGGIEEHVGLNVGGSLVRASAEMDTERTTPEGKTSSVHFLKFHLTPEHIAAFRAAGIRIVLGIDHPNYDHMAALSEDTKAALAADFD